jgi:hypothetical protein
MATKTENPIDETRPLKPVDFCTVENISMSTYRKMKRLGFGPREFRIPGFAFARITPTARLEWRKKIEKQSNSRALKLQHQRRVAQTKVAGKLAAASPLHVSKTRGRRSA